MNSLIFLLLFSQNSFAQLSCQSLFANSQFQVSPALKKRYQDDPYVHSIANSLLNSRGNVEIIDNVRFGSLFSQKGISAEVEIFHLSIVNLNIGTSPNTLSTVAPKFLVALSLVIENLLVENHSVKVKLSGIVNTTLFAQLVDRYGGNAFFTTHLNSYTDSIEFVVW